MGGKLKLRHKAGGASDAVHGWEFTAANNYTVEDDAEVVLAMVAAHPERFEVVHAGTESAHGAKE